MQTLSYETVAARRAVLPPPRWLKVALAVASTVILLAMLVALPPFAGALDYTRDIPLSEAIAYSWRADWAQVLTHPWLRGLTFLMVLEIAATIAIVLGRRAWLTRTAVLVGVVAPFLCAGRYALFLPLITVMALPAWLGREDGETWSEGIVAMGCAGAWAMLWALAALILFLRRRTAVVLADAGGESRRS